jgi:hypothetical protein
MGVYIIHHCILHTTNYGTIKILHIRYVHCQTIYYWCVQALDTGSKVSLWHVSVSVMILLSSTYMQCLSCNVKISKTTAKLTEKSRSMCQSKSFSMVSNVMSALILLPFLAIGSTWIRYQEIVICILDE